VLWISVSVVYTTAKLVVGILQNPVQYIGPGTYGYHGDINTETVSSLSLRTG
jgi:hypothetical protein